MQIFDHNDIQKSFHRIDVELTNLTRPGIVTFNTNEKFSFSLKCDLALNRLKDLDRTIHDLIIFHAQSAERVSPGSFLETITLIKDLLKISSNEHDLETSIISFRPTRSDLDLIIHEFATPDTKDVVNDALNLAGFLGSISIDRSRSNVDVVQLHEGCKFNVQVPFVQRRTLLSRTRIVLIDGHVEEVSEVHRLLDDASMSKENVVIICRGMSNDIMNTLSVNNARGTLNVQPVVVPLEIDNVNIMVDLSIAAGSMCVSSVNGDVTSLKSLKDFSIVDHVELFSTSMSIIDKNLSIRVRPHLSSIRTKMQESGELMNEILKHRLRSLSCHHVMINIVDDARYDVRYRTIENVVRAYKSLISHGCIVRNDRRMLTTTYMISQVQARKCVNLIRDLGCVIC